MLKLVQNLLALSALPMAKAKADTSCDQALALNEAGRYKEPQKIRSRDIAEPGLIVGNV